MGGGCEGEGKGGVERVKRAEYVSGERERRNERREELKMKGE
jgi:hypothetical protein